MQESQHSLQSGQCVYVKKASGIDTDVIIIPNSSFAGKFVTRRADPAVELFQASHVQRSRRVLDSVTRDRLPSHRMFLHYGKPSCLKQIYSK